AAVLPLLKGTYGLAAVSTAQPGGILGAPAGSPPAGGGGAGETFLARDQMGPAGRGPPAASLRGRRLCALSAEAWRPVGPARGAAVRPRPGRGVVHLARDRRAGRGDAGGVRALHAQGDLRAARGPGERASRTPGRAGLDGALRGPEPGRAASAAGRADHPDRVR